MKLVIDFNENETSALRQFAVQNFASADERAIVMVVRSIVIDHLAIAQFLDKELNALEIVNSVITPIIKPTVISTTDKPVIQELETISLEWPIKMRLDKETNTWKVFRFFIQECLSNSSPNWQWFKINDIVPELESLEYKDIDAGIRALRKQNWLMQIGKTQYGFTENAKRFLLTNKEHLKTMALLK